MLRIIEQLRQKWVDRGPTDGRLIYAVGDIHGRVDLLEQLLGELQRDALATPPAEKPVLVFIGDYVDRGPNSKDVLDRLIELKREGEFEVCALKGNHEQSLLAFLRDPSRGAGWCEHGGETLSAYGVTPPASPEDSDGWARTRDAFAHALPLQHLNFLLSLGLTAAYGDYVFVHAGVRPGVALADQTEDDLLWIRADFLAAPGPFEKVVVHGHTPVETASMADDRINIDTGAYATAILTAVRLENAQRRFIQVGAATTVIGDARGPERNAVASAQSRGAASAGGWILSIATLALSGALLGVILSITHGFSWGGHQVAPAPVTVAPAARPVAPAARPVAPAARPQMAPTPPTPAAVSAAVNRPARPEPAPAVSSAPIAVATGPSGDVVVQIGAFPTQEPLDANWRTLNETLPDQFSGRKLTVEIGTNGGRTVYRGLIRGFASRVEAAKFCAVLDAAHRPCFVRPSK